MARPAQRSTDSGASPPPSAPSPAVVLEPIAKDAEPVLRNLFELYAHDFSEYLSLDLQPSGRFDVGVGDAWWISEGHFPFFILYKGKLVGFALVRRGSRVTKARDVMDIAEFFVVRGARRKRIGLHAVHTLFRRFPGPWEIRVRPSNVPAIRFWARVAETWRGGPTSRSDVSSEGVDWHVFRLDHGRGDASAAKPAVR